MTMKRKITPADVLPLQDYAKVRMETRRKLSAVKARRRVEVGPHITFYFESYDTMWLQVQEMLHIEKGGAEQMADELSAYNPLIPQGKELVATFMIEIEDPDRRKRVLARLGGIEETTFIQIGSAKVVGIAEQDQDRTTEEGKASSVQFVHFPMTDAQIAAFREKGAQVILGCGHENYSHMAVMPEAVRAELSGDFD